MECDLVGRSVGARGGQREWWARRGRLALANNCNIMRAPKAGKGGVATTSGEEGAKGTWEGQSSNSRTGGSALCAGAK